MSSRGDPPAQVSMITAAIRSRVAEREEPDGIFLSHCQQYGAEVMHLKGQLERHCPQLAGKVWYDKDRGATAEQSRLGGRGSRYFLLYLTEGALTQPSCRAEIRWALEYGKRRNVVVRAPPPTHTTWTVNPTRWP